MHNQLKFNRESSQIDLEQLAPEVRHVSLRVAELCREHGGTAYLVGGAVRDCVLGSVIKDADMEVFGLAAADLRRVLGREFEVLEVGASFGVFKIRGVELDVSIPRRESKTGRGHKGFAVKGDPHLSLEKAALRRDFTINSIYCRLPDGVLFDPHNGLEHLEQCILRHTSPHFVEDPLRVLRGMQFVARFMLKAAPETIELCQSMTMEDLPPERLFEEWKKLILRGQKPSIGLEFLKETGWLRYFSELQALVDCPQDPEWHPEGDVWVHTLHCLDAFAEERIGDPYEDLVVGLAVLCHDLGKPLTTVHDEGRIRSPGHDAVGEEPTRSFLDRLTRHRALIEDVVPLVLHHMKPNQFYKSGAGDSAVRRLSRQVHIGRLIRVVSADMKGSPPKVRDSEACNWLLEEAEKLAVKDAAPRPFIQGRHLIQLGKKPGPHFGPILARAYEAQLDGAFETPEDAMDWLENHLQELEEVARHEG